MGAAEVCACGPCMDRPCGESQNYDFDIDRTHTRRLESKHLIDQSEDRAEGEGQGKAGSIFNLTGSPTATEAERMRSLTESSTKDVYYYDPVRDEMVEMREELETGATPRIEHC